MQALLRWAFCGLVGIILLTQPQAMGQEPLPQQALDTMHLYRSMQEALATPDQVYKLSLRKQKLQELPQEITKFKNLHLLDLSKNKLKALPADIGSFGRLIDLDLTGNKLTELPSEIGQLTNLRNLRAGLNELEYLPPEIGQLKNLEYLDIWSNNISELPVTMIDLVKLKKVDMRVIQLNTSEKEAIEEILPEEVKIQFSNSCDCD